MNNRSDIVGGLRRIDKRAQQGAVTKSEIGLEAPAVRNGRGVEVFQEEKFAGGTHQSLGRSKSKDSAHPFLAYLSSSVE